MLSFWSWVWCLSLDTWFQGRALNWLLVPKSGWSGAAPGLVQGLGWVRPPCLIPLSAPQAPCCCCCHCCSWLPSPSGHSTGCFCHWPPSADAVEGLCMIVDSILDLSPELGMGDREVMPWMNSPCLLCLHLWLGALLQYLPVPLRGLEQRSQVTTAK